MEGLSGVDTPYEDHSVIHFALFLLLNREKAKRTSNQGTQSINTSLTEVRSVEVNKYSSNHEYTIGM
jgi:hypothetical protein